MNPKYYVAAGAIAVAILAVIILGDGLAGSQIAEEPQTEPQSVEEPLTKPQSVEEPQSDPVMVTDGVRHTIPLDRILSGGPPKDGIPSIDDPVFAAVDAEFMSDSDVVVGLAINGEARAYPIFILVWHEIVNDVVGGVPISVTYCPLCYTNQVFERTSGGQVLEFGVSGKLYNSNLLMYDRQTDSYWSQALGEAVVGELTGAQLDIVPLDVIRWGDWRDLHPDTVVLTTDTGHSRPYGVDPYERYFASDRIIFPVAHRDDRLGPKEIILGFSSGVNYKAYAQSDVEAAGTINDDFAGVPVLLVSAYEQNARAFERAVDGHALEFAYRDGTLTDTDTGSEWSYDGLAVAGPLEGEQLPRLGFSPGFWFEWVSFHPDTGLYGDT